MPDPAKVIAKLIDDCVAATKSNDRKRAGLIAEQLRAELKQAGFAPPDADAVRLVKALRSVRMFDDLAATADMLVTHGSRAPTVRRYMAQGLIDSGQIEAGIAVAKMLAADLDAQIDQIPAADQHGAAFDALVGEHVDAMALIGRAHKQTYVNLAAHGPCPAREAALRRAVQHYLLAFKIARPAQRDFPGANVMALLAMAKRDGIRIDDAPSIEAMAAEVEKAAKIDPKRPYDDPWAAASVAEAYLARNQLQEAADWYGRYAYHPKVDAFALAGTIRQLEEVWGLKAGTKDAGPILAALKARLLHFEGGTVGFSVDERRALARADAGDFGDLSQRVMAGQVIYSGQASVPAGGAASAVNLERTLTKDSALVDFRTMLMAVRRGQAVARICAGPGSTVGTGFIVRASDICPMLGDELLILTNNHVVAKQGSPSPGTMPIAPSLARIHFDIDAIEGEEKSYKCELVWESPITELDATLLRPIPGGAIKHPPLRIAPEDIELVPEQTSNGEPPTRLLIIGHPDGGALKISVEHQQRSTLMDMGVKTHPEHIFLHYRTPTEPGMSGSPVLDEATGALVGLHHAGPKDDKSEIERLNGKPGGIKANEGVLIHSIAREITRIRAGGSIARTAGTTVASLLSRPPAGAPGRPAASVEATGGQAAPKITYAELIARLADTNIDNKSLAPYFRALPEASGPYQPAFAISELVEMGAGPVAAPGGTGPDAAVKAAPGLVQLMNSYCSLDRRARCRARLRAGEKGLRFVSEGDSWFEYPILIDDVIDHLEDSYAIFCLASTSDTLDTIVSEENLRSEIGPAIEEVKPHGFLLSAGGSEVLKLLKTCLVPYDRRLEPAQYLNADFTKALLGLEKKFALAINRLVTLRPGMKIFVHGYDMRAPQRRGAWLGSSFEAQGIVELELQREITDVILDRVAGMHRALERKHPDRVYFVDTRHCVPAGEWHDELHPTSKGFAHVADRFRMRIEQAFGTRSQPPMPGRTAGDARLGGP